MLKTKVYFEVWQLAPEKMMVGRRSGFLLGFGNFSGASCQVWGWYEVRELPPKSRSSTHKTFPGTAFPPPPGTRRLNLLNFPLQPPKKNTGARCISNIEISKSILGRFPMFWQLHGGTKQPTNIVYYTYSPWYVYTCNYISKPWWYPRPTKTAEWIVPVFFFSRGAFIALKINYEISLASWVGDTPNLTKLTFLQKKKHERNVTWTRLAGFPGGFAAVSPCTLGICILTALSCHFCWLTSVGGDPKSGEKTSWGW